MCRATCALLMLVGLCWPSWGCGGGGTVVGGIALLDGTWCVFWYETTDGAPDSARSALGAGPIDASGTFSVPSAVNDGGTILSMVALPGTYSIAAGDELGLTLGTSGMTGKVDAARTVGFAGSTTSGGKPGLGLLGKTGSGFTTASLTGVYHFGAFGIESSGTARTIFGTATFDGLGGVTLDFSSNAEGITGGPSTSVGTYIITPEGVFSLLTGFQGCVLEGGEAFAASGEFGGAGDPAWILFGTRATTGASASLFSGSYRVVGIERDVAANTFRSLTGPATADGAGMVTVTFTVNDDGTVSTQPPAMAPYTVGPTGALTATGGSPLVGGVSPSGKFIVLAGGTMGGDGPAFYVGVR